MALDQTLKALNDPIRRAILSLLKQRSMSVQEIVDQFSISQPAISRHLSILKKADLIRNERQGKYIVYTLNTSVLEDVILWIKNLEGEKYVSQNVSERSSH